MDVIEVKLYGRASNGSMRYWSIRAECYEIIMEYGELNGSPITKSEYVTEGKGGRDIDEQLDSRVQSRINQKLDIGYVYSLAEAKLGNKTNALGLLKPMLAQPIDRVRDFNMSDSYVQYKFDGHRCLITRQEGKLLAYSRNGKLIESIPEILSGIEIGEGMTLDGELYHHGAPLQTISSWIKRRQENSKKLRYHCYDMVSDDNFRNRLMELKTINLGEKAFVVGTYRVDDEDDFELQDNLVTAIADGYEGLIIRPDGFGYEDGKRSKGLIKVKKFHDDEFRVVDITASVDNYAVLTCVMANGKRFNATAPGTVPQKVYVLKNKDDFLGRMVQIKYANFTKKGIPFHPIATRWREKGTD